MFALKEQKLTGNINGKKRKKEKKKAFSVDYRH